MAKQKVKIQYGIFAGEQNGANLRKALRKGGYEVVKRVEDADIIMAHSAGCFWLPQAPTHQKLMLVDPPYWPGRTIRERARSRSSNNWHFKQYGYMVRPWLIRNLWGIYYSVRDFRRTIRIMRHVPSYHLEQIIRNHTVLLVRNEHDDWLTPNLAELQRSNPSLVVAGVPGDHDDIIHHPERYVSLLQSFVD